MARSLTASIIEALPPKEKPYQVFDGRERGLCLRVSPQGAKTFRYRARSLGKVVTLGPWSSASKPGHVTLSQARTLVERLREARRGGVHELAKIEADIKEHVSPPLAVAADGKTVGDAATEWWPVLDVQRKRGSSEARKIYEKHIERVLGPLPLEGPNKVQKRHCSAVIEKAIKSAPVHSAKVLALMKQLLDFAGRRYTGDDWANPAARLKAGDFGVRNNRRKRWLSEQEIPVFWKVLENWEGSPETKSERQRLSAALRLLLLLGLRTSELRLARWSEVDLDARVLKVPVANRKLTLKQAEHATDFLVPLGPTALILFRELKKLAGDSPWVVPSKESKAGIYTEKAVGRAMRRLWCGEKPSKGRPKRMAGHPALASLKPATPHDLRRSTRSHLGRLGVDPHIAERCLGHSLGRIVDIYDRGDYLEQRRTALERWDAEIQRMILQAG